MESRLMGKHVWLVERAAPPALRKNPMDHLLGNEAALIHCPLPGLNARLPFANNPTNYATTVTADEDADTSSRVGVGIIHVETSRTRRRPARMSSHSIDQRFNRTSAVCSRRSSVTLMRVRLGFRM